MVQARYQVAKEMLKEVSKDNDDLLKKISDVMSKVTKLEKIWVEVERNTMAFIERKDALERELEEVKTALVDKTTEIEAHVTVDND